MGSQSPWDTPFDELPNPKQVWVGKPGSHEEGLGKLAILTPEVVAKAAAAEIKTGRRVTMNWDMTKLDYPNLNRQPCNHQIIPLLGGVAFDDIYTMNPRRSLPGVDLNLKLTHWAKEGIAGRGVLIDYATWAEKKGIKYTTFSTHQVRLSDMLEIAKECNITFQKGDILLVRVGVTKEWDTIMTDAQKQQYSDNPSPEHAGVEATTDVLRWLWDTGFAAIASDAISWEVYPPQNPDLFLHEYVLAGWGMPIGELFDLEALASTCQELQRWTFFVASVPLNMPGGVSSPPNMMAIF
ncbi:hypothetical protein KXV73_001330 [Aspergillus fumigatus]|nr:hypothetical protein KXV73_001330 [Aspergillus fumigatus]